MTISVTGAAEGDTVVVGAPANISGQLMISAFVKSGGGSVTVRLYNPTATPITPPAGTYRVDVWQH